MGWVRVLWKLCIRLKEGVFNTLTSNFPKKHFLYAHKNVLLTLIFFTCPYLLLLPSTLTFSNPLLPALNHSYPLLQYFFDWNFLWSQFIFGPQIIMNQIFFLPIFGYKISIGLKEIHAKTHKFKYIHIFYPAFLDQRLFDPEFFGPKFCYV